MGLPLFRSITFELNTSLPRPPPTPTQPTLLTIPPELLLNIISHLPTSADFFPLVQTSRGLKSFFAAHAAQICNTHITKHYALEAAILQPQLTKENNGNGNTWLIPTLPCIRRGELHRYQYSTQSSSKGADNDLLKRLSLTVPGPQFLASLECCHDEIRTWMRVDEGETTPRGTRLEWALGTYTFPRFANMVGEFVAGFEEERGNEGAVVRLREKVAEKVVVVKQGLMERKKKGGERAALLFGEIEKVGEPEIEKREGFGKGLLWYYGRSGVCPLESRPGKTRQAGKIRKCACNMRQKIKRIGASIETVFRRLDTCSTGFEALD